MKNTPKNPEGIIERQICGLHQYVLTEPKHICYVSRSLCDMLGVKEGDLLSDSKDLYAGYVHPADQEKYVGFLTRLSSGKDPAGEEYRLVKKDGTIIYVKDTAIPQKGKDGVLTAVSTLADITDLKSINKDLHFLNETLPCGFMRYTCEKQPRVTYINQKMMEILRYSQAKDGELDYLEMFRSNIFLMIPMEERRKFSNHLNRVYAADAPIAGEMTLLRCDGTRAHVFGWVTKTVNAQGDEEFQTVCMDITERHQARKAEETQRYLKGLSDVYDMIFEFNLDTNTVKCLHCGEDSSFKRFKNIAMQMEDALEKWLFPSVVPENLDGVRTFFKDFSQKRLHQTDGKPPQLTYKAWSSSDVLRQYTGLFIKLDDSVSLFCCRIMQDTADADALKTENIQLKQSVKNLARQFTDGIAAFEVSPQGYVKPLYASENVYQFFGYTEEEWLRLTECFTPLENFVMYSEVKYEDFADLFRKGEEEFSYFDYTTHTERRLKAVFSQKTPSSNSSRYVMLYDVDSAGEKQNATLPENRPVSIRTFGYFDVFVGNKPIAFSNKKAKELLALLVDRRGGYVTSEEAAGFLWEDDPLNAVTYSRYRKVALRLKNTLEEYGISDIMETVDGKRRIVMENVECDLYNYLTGKEEYAQLFNGSYLTNYSWGETTLGELIEKQK